VLLSPADLKEIVVHLVIPPLSPGHLHKPTVLCKILKFNSFLRCFISLINFSTTILNKIGDIASPCLKPDLTNIGSVIMFPTQTLTNVSKLLISISFISLSSKWNSLKILIRLSLCMLSYAFLKSMKKTCISLSNSHVF